MLLSPHSCLVSKEKNETNKERREDEYRELYVNIAADVRASWKKVAKMCMFLYSTDKAFTRQKHDKYLFQAKDQKPTDKDVFETHVKL